MASQLSLYQDALALVGERSLTDLTEDREPRRLLDEVFDRGAKYCLEQGFWNWAMRAVQMTPDVGLATSFSYRSAFLKPDDWVRTYIFADNERFEPAYTDYRDENGYFFADLDECFVMYVSNHTGWGLNLAIWPETFSNFVATHLARRICRRLTNSQDLYETLWKLEKIAKTDAMAKDAMNGGPTRMPMGTWVSSRARGTNSTSSRWNGSFS